MELFKEIESYENQIAPELSGGDLATQKELQRVAEWKEQRKGKFTGSKFSDLMKKGKGSLPFGETCKTYMCEKLIERLTGDVIEVPETWQMRRGTINEVVAKEFLRQYYDYAIQEVGFLEIIRCVAGASPDGLIPEVGALEIKCRNGMAHYNYGLTPVTEKHDDFWQMQGEMMAAGVDACLYANFNPDISNIEAKCLIQIVEKDIEACDRLLERIGLCEMHVKEAEKLGLLKGFIYLKSL